MKTRPSSRKLSTKKRKPHTGSIKIKKNKVLIKQEDNGSHMKTVNGQLYDFRCHFCKVLPRYGKPCRSELYRHYSLRHYSKELREEFGPAQPNCPICGKRQRSNYHSHLGQVHNEVEKFLPEVARIPGKTQAQVRPTSTHLLEENDQDSFLDSVIESCEEKENIIEEVVLGVQTIFIDCDDNEPVFPSESEEDPLTL